MQVYAASSVGDVQQEVVEVQVDKVARSSSSCSSSNSSYVSKIAQKVFVDYAAPQNGGKSDAKIASAKRVTQASGGGGEFQGELKEKCMTFFSSVTRSKGGSNYGPGNNTKL